MPVVIGNQSKLMWKWSRPCRSYPETQRHDGRCSSLDPEELQLLVRMAGREAIELIGPLNWMANGVPRRLARTMPSKHQHQQGGGGPVVITRARTQHVADVGIAQGKGMARRD